MMARTIRPDTVASAEIHLRFTTKIVALEEIDLKIQILAMRLLVRSLPAVMLGILYTVEVLRRTAIGE
jgi:hypothetical protein